MVWPRRYLRLFAMQLRAKYHDDFQEENDDPEENVKGETSRGNLPVSVRMSRY